MSLNDIENKDDSDVVKIFKTVDLRLLLSIFKTHRYWMQLNIFTT